MGKAVGGAVEREPAPLVRYECRDGIALVELNRPHKLNAMSRSMLSELRRALVRLDEDEDAAVAILHGAGRAFSSGADLVEAAGNRSEPSGDVWSSALRPRDLFHGFANWKPIVAAVHGYALGAGLGLALRCDTVVVDRNTVFQVAEVAHGLPAGVLWELLHFRGAGAFADDVALTGRRFTGEEAANRGIAMAADDGRHLEVARRYAGMLRDLSPKSVRSTVRVRRWHLREAERASGPLGEQRPVAGADHVRMQCDTPGREPHDRAGAAC